MDELVEVRIPVEPAAAIALRDEGTRVEMGLLVSKLLRQRNNERLLDAMQRLGAEAQRRGLTLELLDEELAAFNHECGYLSRQAALPGNWCRHSR